MAGLLTRLRGGRKAPEVEAAPTDPIAAAEARLVTDAQDSAARRLELARRIASGEPVADHEVLAACPHAADRAALRRDVEAVRETRAALTRASALEGARLELAAARERQAAHREKNAELMQRLAREGQEHERAVDLAARAVEQAEQAERGALAAAPAHLREAVERAREEHSQARGCVGGIRQQVAHREAELARCQAEQADSKRALSGVPLLDHAARERAARAVDYRASVVAEAQGKLDQARGELPKADELEARLPELAQAEAAAWAALRGV